MATRQTPGRFLKKDNPVIKHLSLIDYSFAELSAKYTTPLAHDNLSSNIIQKDVHTQESLDNSVKKPHNFDQVLNDDHIPVPQIIMPKDFTRDYEAMRSKSKNSPDENEYLDRIYEEEIFKGAQNKVTKTPSEQKAQEHAGATESPKNAENKETQPFFKMIPDKTKSTESSQEILEELSQASPEQVENLKNFGKQAEETTKSSEGFIPSFSNVADGENPEAKAIEMYKEQLQREVAEIENLKKQAQASGYEDGFSEGEKKGIVQARKIAEDLFQSLQSLIGDLESLRQDLIKQANNNFFEIAQAISQTLIQREINLDPTAFSALINQAVSDIVPSDQFTIKVSPSMAEKLKAINLSDLLKNRIVADGQMQESDFMIDSKLSSLRADLPTLIANVIEKINEPIFANQDVDKAG